MNYKLIKLIYVAFEVSWAVNMKKLDTNLSKVSCFQISVFDRHGFEIRIAGGAVRDLLSGQTPHDIDLVNINILQKNNQYKC